MVFLLQADNKHLYTKPEVRRKHLTGLQRQLIDFQDENYLPVTSFVYETCVLNKF